MVNEMSKRLYLIAVGIELVGISIVGVGVGMELTQGGMIYLALITGGSLLVATGGILFGKFLKKS